MKVMVVASQKGGGGKTATTCQLAYYLLDLTVPTLLLDLDMQMNATRCMLRGRVAAVARFSTTQVFEGHRSALPAGDLVLVPADQGLGELERQPQRHNDFVNALQAFLQEVAPRFRVCLIDTHPSPDVRYVAALATADLVLSPIVLTQEALEGVGAFLHHPRHGYLRIRERLNPRLELVGLLPNMVEATPFQRANLRQLVEQHPGLLIPVQRGEVAGYALIPTRTAIAEAQAAGVPLWQLRQAAPAGAAKAAGAMPLRSAARDAWREIRPSFEAIARRLGVGG
ncbi:chromosome partitioning protein ParA [Duganella sp. HH101]|nr:chromosome partitioning protein ParA [Duganella sp. HH101]